MYIYSEKELFEILKKSGYRIIPPQHKYHFLIYGSIKEPIGCTSNRLDVLFEERDVRFVKINKKDCPICKE